MTICHLVLTPQPLQSRMSAQSRQPLNGRMYLYTRLECVCSGAAIWHELRFAWQQHRRCVFFLPGLPTDCRHCTMQRLHELHTTPLQAMMCLCSLNGVLTKEMLAR